MWKAGVTVSRRRTPRPLSFQAYLEVLEELVRSAGMEAPLREIALRMGQAVGRFVGADFVLHYTLEEERLVPFVAHGLGPGQKAPLLRLEGGWGEQARTAREPVLLREGDLPEGVRALGARTALLFPVYAEERFGLSLACFRVPRRFTTRDMRLLARGIVLIGQAFALARSRRLEARLRSTQSALLSVLRTALSAADLDRMARDLLRVMVEHFQAASGLAWVVEEGRLVPRAGYGVDPALYPTVDLKRPAGVVGRAVALRRPVVVGPEEIERLSFRVSLEQGIRQVAAVPVQVGEEVVGAFSLGWKEERPFSASALDLLALMAGTVGPAILNARAVEAEREVARRRDLLLRVLEGAVRSPSTEGLLHGLLTALAEHWGARHGVVRLVDREAGLLRPVASVGIPLERYRPMRLDPPEGIASRAAVEGRPFLVRGEAARRLGHATVREWGIQQVVAVPMRSGEEVIGTLTLAWEEPRSFSPEDLALLDLSANSAVAPLTRAQALEAERSARRASEALAGALQRMLRAEGVQDALQGLVEVLTDRYGADVGFVYLRDPSARLYRPVASVGAPLEVLGPLPEDTPYGLVGEAVRRRCTVLMEGDAFRETAGANLLSMGLVQGVAVSLDLEGRVEAAVVLAWRQPRAVHPQDLRVLELAVAGAGPVLLRARAQEAERLRLEELSALSRIADVLTQPGTFLERVHRLLEEVSRIAEADWASLRLPTPDGRGLEKVATAGLRAPDLSAEDRVIPMDRSVSGRAFRTGEPQVVHDYPRAPEAFEAMVRRGIGSLLSVPIRSGGQVVGVLNVSSTRVGHFTPERVRPIAFTADLIGALLEQSRLLEAEQRARRRLEALESVAMAGLSALHTEEAVEVLLERLVQVTGAEGALLRLADESGEEFHLVGVVGLPAEQVHPRMSLKGTPIARLLTEGKTLVLRGKDLEDPSLSPALRSEGVRAVVVSPLESPHKILGLVALVYRKEPEELAEVAYLAEAAADRIALALEASLAQEAEQKARRRLEALERVIEAGLSALDPDEAIRTVLARLVEAVGGMYGLFRRWDEERGVLVAEALHNIPPEQVRREMPPAEGFSSRLLAERRPLLRRLADLPPALLKTFSPFFRSPTVRALGGVPLYGRRGLLGVLLVGFAEEPADPEEALRLMEVAGERVALSVETALAYRALREQAMRDPLTGLLNRREFFRRLEEELARARRTGGVVSVLMVDLDRFKAVNEAFGHVVGDQLLQELAEEVLRPALRPYDVIARYGGDEFAVLLPGAGKEDARRVGRRLQEALRRHTFRVLPADGWGVDLSVGFASFPEDGDTATELVERADDALRSAKVEGRGRVVAYSAREVPSPAPLPGRERVQGVLADALLAALDLRVPGSARRSRAVAGCARLLAERMGHGAALAEQAFWAGLLRDIGQLVLPPAPFLRPPRNAEEEAAVRQHPTLSADLLGAHARFQAVVPALLAHHERWDGTGYPGRLRGEQIPLAARLVAGAELFVLTALDEGTERARQAVERERGRALDPAVADALLAHADALADLLREA